MTMNDGGNRVGNGVKQRVLQLGRDAPRERTALAADMLARGEAAVALEAIVVLRFATDVIHCEIVDPDFSAHRCAEEYRVLMENAARALERSELRQYLTHRAMRWVIRDERGEMKDLGPVSC